MNLRNIFQSKTLRNFVLYAIPEILPALGDYSFEEICGVIKARMSTDLTQKQMAQLLDMTENSYSDIETGEYMCGTLTAVLLLAEQEDPAAYLQELKSKFDELYERAMQPV